MLSAAHTWSLAAIAVAAGAGWLWALRHFSDQERIQLCRRQMRAQLYGLRLFADEPRLVLRAQRRLLAWCGRYLAAMLRPTAVLTVPMLLLLVELNAVYGFRPLEAGEAAIVTAQFSRGVRLSEVDPVLEGQGIAIETPAVRLPARLQACWRVRAISGTSGRVWLRAPGIVAAKTVWTGAGWLLDFAVPRLPVGAAIEIAYPHALIDVFGCGVPWLVWFCAVSLFASLALRKVLGVTF
jgi:hypothetical protein